MSQQTTTDREYRVLRAVITNQYHDGQDPINNEIWVSEIDAAREPSGISGKALSGVVSSLSKKGLVVTDGECISVTEAGFIAAQGGAS